MFYDFYCNEKMLLDNYKKNDLGNRALKRVIGRSGMTPDKCADMYLTMFDNSLNLNYDRYDLVRHFETCGTKACELLQIDSIKVYKQDLATVYKGNIIKNLIMDCQSYTKYRPNETTGGIFVSWRRKEELPTGA